MNKDIYSYSIDELQSLFGELGLPRFRAQQLFEWLHTHNAISYDQMTNLPKALRQQLSIAFPLSRTTLKEKQTSSDGTRKYLLELSDNELVESVGIPSPPPADKSVPNVSRETFLDVFMPSTPSNEMQRLTVCFSTQVGCGMGCVFCATGQEGLSRNLSAQEIVDQVVTVQQDFGQRVSNLVAMGQGEPFLNYENLMMALRRFNTDKGFQIGARHITVSTCGILQGIQQFTQEPEQFTLAVSLHSAVQVKRNYIMPALASQPLDQLRSVIEEYISKTRRRITFEYLLLQDINDTEEDLLALIEYCKGLLCHINLIPFNETGAALQGSSMDRIKVWLQRLNANNISTTLRHSKGADIAGACGQLKNVSRETF